MCDSCIKRIFHDGPNNCPIAGCGKYLRPQRFKIPRFEDLAIERECDIRARVARILNHQQSDFETLRAYNDYEEWKEEIIMSLVENRDVEKIEKQLEAYSKENANTIATNADAEAAQRDAVAEHERLRQERSELARAEAVRQRQEELAEREAGRREVVDKIMNANADVLRVAKEAENVFKQRAATRSGASEAGALAKTKTLMGSSLKSKASTSASSAKAGADATLGVPAVSTWQPAGLKKPQAKRRPGEKAAEEKQEPYDAFGLEIQLRYYTLNEAGYWHPWSNEVLKDPKQCVGGLHAMDYQRRAQIEAHAGLGVFVGEEKALD
ncbi:MAG: hypothetical protein LQ340_001723 [Diploschistes diacapsis]|nr:MAG: hypothetical protein LQ340_001723 [Diploschistes diacapsis]